MSDADHHFRVIEKAVLAGPGKANATWRVASWARCLQDYKLNPSSADFVCLTSTEVREERDVYEEDLRLADSELEATLAMIEGGGYSAHIANRNGVIISERRSKDSTYYCTSDTVGALWTEEVGGTNGIGTSLRNQAATAVYLSDHFYADLTGEACASAPFFDASGELLGIVNLSTHNPGVPQLAHRVVFGVAQATAYRLEASYFRNRFRDCFTVTVNADQHTPAIIALDGDARVVGATRSARKLLKIGDSAIGARALWAVFEKINGNPSLDQLCDRPRDLRLLQNGATFGSTFTRPQSPKPAIAAVQAPGARKTSRPASAKPAITLADCAGGDPRMKWNVATLRKVAGTGLSLLLLGETGTGKDTLARALHSDGDRSAGPFVAFNCSAVPEALIDSELFGYTPGAFTGASKDGNAGRILEADKGTLFLDEIGDMPLQLQTRFLRFLETQEVLPLGGGKPRSVDVQVIAATHQDLEARVASGAFRRDLFYRLAGTVVMLPPLRERADLRAMITSLLKSASDGAPATISPAAWEQLLRHSWPGNVRELRNVLTRATRLASGNVIQPSDLMLPNEAAPGDLVITNGGRDESDLSVSSRAASDSAVRDAIRAAIERYGPDAAACCKVLGISRATLYRKLKQFDLSLTGS